MASTVDAQISNHSTWRRVNWSTILADPHIILFTRGRELSLICCSPTSSTRQMALTAIDGGRSRKGKVSVQLSQQNPINGRNEMSPLRVGSGLCVINCGSTTGIMAVAPRRWPELLIVITLRWVGLAVVDWVVIVVSPHCLIIWWNYSWLRSYDAFQIFKMKHYQKFFCFLIEKLCTQPKPELSLIIPFGSCQHCFTLEAGSVCMRFPSNNYTRKNTTTEPTNDDDDGNGLLFFRMTILSHMVPRQSLRSSDFWILRNHRIYASNHWNNEKKNFQCMFLICFSQKNTKIKNGFLRCWKF